MVVELGDGVHSAPIRALAFDPSSALLLSGGDDKTLRVWRLEDKLLLHQW
jgi:WD40 repeat protein